jgi:hypothetical protein
MNEYPDYRSENSDLVPVNPDKIEQVPNHDPNISALSVVLFWKRGHAEISNEETTTEVSTRLGTRPRPGKTVGKATV